MIIKLLWNRHVYLETIEHACECVCMCVFLRKEIRKVIECGLIIKYTENIN